MTVVPFKKSRFTPDDIKAFDAVAQDRIKAGRWKPVMRLLTPHRDCLIVTLAGMTDPFISFERDVLGTYEIWYWDKTEWMLVRSSDQASDCHRFWEKSGSAKSRDQIQP